MYKNTWNAPYAYTNFPSWQMQSMRRHEENRIIAEHHQMTIEDAEKLHEDTRAMLLALTPQKRQK